MSVTDAIALILALAAMLSSLAAFVTALLTYARLGEVHHAVNGQSERLLGLTATASFAAGKLQGPVITSAAGPFESGGTLG